MDKSEVNVKKLTNDRIEKNEFTREMRKEYTYWVKFKNSFTFPRDQKKKLARSYRPEDDDYRSSIQKYNWLLYMIAGILGAFLFIYLIGRFLLNWFRGPKSHITAWYSRFSLLMIFVSFTLFCVFNGIALNKIMSVQ